MSSVDESPSGSGRTALFADATAGVGSVRGTQERRQTMTTLVPRLWNDMAEWLEDVSPRNGFIRVEDHLTDTEYTVRAELPGLDPDKDVHLSVAHGLLTIRAERKDEKQSRYRTEFRYGLLQRTVALPESASVDKIQARYRDGILEITVPLKAKTEPKHIAIAKE
jgi:HSP20 family molecular chaperone IbpA